MQLFSLEGMFPEKRRRSPVSPCLCVEQVVKSAHLAGCDGEAGEFAIRHDLLEQPEQTSVCLFPNLVGGSPEDDDGVSDCAVEELGHFPGHPEDAGVGYDPQAGVVPYVGLEPQSWGVVHADHALCAVNLCTRSRAQNVAGAGQQCTVVATQRHILEKEEDQRRSIGAFVLLSINTRSLNVGSTLLP